VDWWSINVNQNIFPHVSKNCSNEAQNNRHQRTQVSRLCDQAHKTFALLSHTVYSYARTDSASWLTSYGRKQGPNTLKIVHAWSRPAINAICHAQGNHFPCEWKHAQLIRHKHSLIVPYVHINTYYKHTNLTVPAYYSYIDPSMTLLVVMLYRLQMEQQFDMPLLE
jgi:hypothetical protein